VKPIRTFLMEKYLDDYESAQQAASNADQLVAVMKQKYPAWTQEELLVFSAKKSFSGSNTQMKSATLAPSILATGSPFVPWSQKWKSSPVLASAVVAPRRILSDHAQRTAPSRIWSTKSTGGNGRFPL
jgi:hypothetical protein